ncbi:hypothetical protein JRQ81_000010, partial [Phrynocephalus forsythii]
MASKCSSHRLLTFLNQISFFTGDPQCFRRYQVAVWAACFVIVLLVAVVINLVNSTCRLCPGHWNLHRDKCYWKSQHVKTWNQSRDDCLRKNAELLVIQDKEEMEFIKQSIEDKITYWIGLAFSVKKWMWVTGTQLDQNL